VRPSRIPNLDLAVISDAPLPLAVSARLADDFSESDLPWRVDIVEWATTQPAFRAVIARDKVVIQAADPSRLASPAAPKPAPG
jgi:type I restriction enzyme S subunit